MNSFEPCRHHANGHFPTCLLCEVDACRSEAKKQRARAEAAEAKLDELRPKLELLLELTKGTDQEGT